MTATATVTSICDGPDCETGGPVFMLDVLTELARLTRQPGANLVARRTLAKHFASYYHHMAGRVLVGEEEFQASWGQDQRMVVPVFVAEIPGIGPLGFELETGD